MFYAFRDNINIIMSSSRVLLVGGGITSALTASILHESLPNLCLTVWDKARGAGGRMSTSRSASNPHNTVDLGAQYISATPHYFTKHQDIYKSMIGEGVFVPANVSLIEGMREERLAEGERTQHFVVPEGMSSLVKHVFAQSGAEMHFGRRISEINQQNTKWLVKTECGLEDLFDMVVLTMPAPQILALNGDVRNLINQTPSIKTGLGDVSYSTRFVLGMFYEDQVNLGVGWACKYISDHPIIRFISIDNIKRTKMDSATSVLIHSTVQFGLENIDKSHEEMKPVIVEAVKEMFPSWPGASEFKSLKWLYSQVHKGYPGAPGAVVLNSSPLLVMGGDAFSQSNFDGCIESAKSISEKVEQSLNSEASR